MTYNLSESSSTFLFLELGMLVFCEIPSLKSDSSYEMPFIASTCKQSLHDMAKVDRGIVEAMTAFVNLLLVVG